MHSEVLPEEIVMPGVPWYRAFADDIVAIALVATTLFVGLLICRQCIEDRRWFHGLLLPLLPVALLLAVFLVNDLLPTVVPDELIGGAFPLYGIVFGACILAPLASDPHRVLRCLAMATLPVLLGILVSFLLAELGVTYLSLFLGSLFLTMGLAISAVLIAPLRVTKRYWVYMLLVGSATGFSIGYCLHHFFCLFPGCPDWYDYVLFVPFAVTPILFSAALHAGLQQDC